MPEQALGWVPLGLQGVCQFYFHVVFVQVPYTDRIPFVIRQNADSDVCLDVQGFGSEPQLEFDRNLLSFTPVLPFAPGVESEVSVRNPMPYPVEFYSLEFDKQYIEEEEVRLLYMYASFL